MGEAGPHHFSFRADGAQLWSCGRRPRPREVGTFHNFRDRCESIQVEVFADRFLGRKSMSDEAAAKFAPSLRRKTSRPLANSV